jgi:hypothetical protein
VNPALLGRVLFGSLVVAGLALLIAGGLVAADLPPLTVLQAPLLASTGLGGLALVLTGLGLLTAHLRREQAADEKALMEELLVGTVALLEAKQR